MHLFCVITGLEWLSLFLIYDLDLSYPVLN